MDNVPEDPLYALRDIPGKGEGLIALKSIIKDTRILSEPPLLTIRTSTPSIPNLQNSILHQVSTLSTYQRNAFLSLHNIYSRENEKSRSLSRQHPHQRPPSIHPSERHSIYLPNSQPPQPLPSAKK